MLAPTDRRLLLDALAPPDGCALDQAIGTTYTLDLLALLRVPLAATALPWSAPRGGPMDNPFALLTALRRNASRISLYCHAGATKVPARHVPLLAFLEDARCTLSPRRTPEGCYTPRSGSCDSSRTASPSATGCSSSRATSRSTAPGTSRSPSTASCASASDPSEPTNQLAEFLAGLPGMAAAAGHPVTPAAAARAELLADEIRRVEWRPPAGFDAIAFHPIGHNRRATWPVHDLYRLLVISPFVEAEALARLRAETREELLLISRFDELAKLDEDALAHAAYVAVFDDPSALLDVDGDPDADAQPETDQAAELAGLHAKVFAGERYRRAVVYVGSANATTAAFERNVELLVELEGVRTQHGIGALRDALDTAGLLAEFTPGTPVEQDEALALDRRLERAAHELASGALAADVEQVGAERWRTRLLRTRPVDLDGVHLDARPLSDQTLHRVDLAADPCCLFAPSGLTSITPSSR